MRNAYQVIIDCIDVFKINDEKDLQRVFFFDIMSKTLNEVWL